MNALELGACVNDAFLLGSFTRHRLGTVKLRVDYDNSEKVLVGCSFSHFRTVSRGGASMSCDTKRGSVCRARSCQRIITLVDGNMQFADAGANLC